MFCAVLNVGFLSADKTNLPKKPFFSTFRGNTDFSAISFYKGVL
jgi:hypothetical protein